MVTRALGTLGVRLTEPTTPARLLRRGDVTIEAMERFLGEDSLPRLEDRERRFVATRMRYGGYIERQERDRLRLRREEERTVPEAFDYRAVPGLSNEVVEKLSRARPATLAQAARISGVTPAALTLINIWLEKARRAAASTSKTCP